ncbi:MAG TPA: beta-propeller fold lactonase family protein [Burkholderiales bacterium]|nr:beta-propeller fold lactonase family protein [Burkholderiales bacterium]
MIELDCCGQGAAAGRRLIDCYNASEAGSRFIVRLDSYGAGLRMWLLEAGVRHRAVRSANGSWELLVARGLSPAQGSLPGMHHAVSDARGSVWTCRRDSRVLRIDASERRVVAAADVASAAAHLALDGERGLLFVADAGGDRVIALRASDLGVLAQWPAPGAPQLPLVSPEGVVCVAGGASGTLTIAHPRRGAYEPRTIQVGNCPHEAALTLDGGHVFVSCAGEGGLVKVRLRDGAVVGRCRTGDGPAHLQPLGARLYVAHSWDGTLACVTEEGEVLARAESGGGAHALRATPDGRWLYCANFLDDTLAVFDAADLRRVALLETEAYPHGLDISPDGRRVVATGYSSDFVRVYDAARHAELARIEVGRGSSHTAFSPDSGTAFVACSVDDHVACVDLAGLRREAAIGLQEGR